MASEIHRAGHRPRRGTATRWAASLALIGWLACVGWMTVAVGASATSAAGDAASARPYREGPLDARVPTPFPDWPALPGGADELLGLSVLLAVVYGLRASGLGRVSRRS